MRTNDGDYLGVYARNDVTGWEGNSVKSTHPNWEVLVRRRVQPVVVSGSGEAEPATYEAEWFEVDETKTTLVTDKDEDIPPSVAGWLAGTIRDSRKAGAPIALFNPVRFVDDE